MGGLTIGLALWANGLLLHHWHSRPIHLHIQDAHRLAGDDGQIQLEGPLDLVTFASAMSPPMASAARSTALVVTSKSAKTCICW
jgi:hypothetical protein